MASYLILNFVFMAIFIGISPVRRSLFRKQWFIGLTALLIMTAVFDSLLVGFNIVAYDEAKILAIYIGKAPIEDFAYTLLAFILIPTLWIHFGRKHQH